MSLFDIYKSNVITDYSLIQYNDNMFRFVVRNIKYNDNTQKKGLSLTTSNNSNILRSKRKVRELALSNDFEYFVTLTVSPLFCDRTDLDIIISALRKYLKKYKRKHEDFAYILIAEKHKDGSSYHFHGLMKGIDKEDIYKNKMGYNSCYFFDDIGFNSFSKIQSLERVSNYITKYITKDLCKTSSGHSYFCSRGLVRPTVTHYMPFGIDELIKCTYKNDYCRIFDFDINTLNKKDLYKLLYTLNKYKTE